MSSSSGRGENYLVVNQRQRERSRSRDSTHRAAQRRRRRTGASSSPCRCAHCGPWQQDHYRDLSIRYPACRPGKSFPIIRWNGELWRRDKSSAYSGDAVATEQSNNTQADRRSSAGYHMGFDLLLYERQPQRSCYARRLTKPGCAESFLDACAPRYGSPGRRWPSTARGVSYR